MTASFRKSWADLGRHRLKTALTAAAVAMAVASIAVVAVPSLIDRAMDQEVTDTKLADLTLPTRDLPLDEHSLDSLRALPDIAAIGARTILPTRVRVGSSEAQAVVRGLDVDRQDVNVLHIDRGRLPGAGEAVLDGTTGVLGQDIVPGKSVEVTRADGSATTLVVSGTGHSLATSTGGTLGGSSQPVLYTTNETAHQLARRATYDELDVRLVDASAPATDRLLTAVVDRLTVLAGRPPLSDLPQRRTPGDWPGRAVATEITSLFSVLALLALGSAVLLVAATMKTVVADQAVEIATMKVLGGRRRQITSIVLRTSLLLGGIAGVAGAVAGVPIAWAITTFFTGTMASVRPGPLVDLRVLLLSLAVGPLMAVVATIPALVHGLRPAVADTLHGPRSSRATAGGWLDRAVTRASVLPRSARHGLRNALRNRRRATTTVAQVALAVATALALLGLGASVTTTLADTYQRLGTDVTVQNAPGAPLLGPDAIRHVRAIEGVRRVEPVLEQRLDREGAPHDAFGFAADSLFHAELSAGRWFTADEVRAQAPVVVLGPAIARRTGASVGDTYDVQGPTGPARLTVIGIDTTNYHAGQGLYLPLTTLQHLKGVGDTANSLWIATDAHDRGAVDRVAGAVDGRLRSDGRTVQIRRSYLDQAREQATFDAISHVLTITGLLIVAIGLLGLASTMTANLIERTNEIGVLRSLSARRHDIRNALRIESVALVAVGWAIGLPLAWLLTQGLRRLVLSFMAVDVPSLFPWSDTVLVGAVAIVLAIMVVAGPARRATRLRPADALRQT